MAGHNKWSKIKRTKGNNDVKKSKQYTKIVREITVAVKEGGLDTNHNARLRVAIQHAKHLNMPKENIERAIQKSNDMAHYTTINYEAYGPYGIALWIIAMTDNTNRTLSFVRSTLHKYEGNLAKNGALQYLFSLQWMIEISKEQISEEENFLWKMMDHSVEHIDQTPHNYILYCDQTALTHVQQQLSADYITIQKAQLIRKPQQTKPITTQSMEKLSRLKMILENNADIQNIYHNAVVIKNVSGENIQT